MKWKKWFTMSFVGKMFGGKKEKVEVKTTGGAIQELREREEILLKQQDFLEKKITSDRRWR